MESLHIPTRERLKGQTIWCKACNTTCSTLGKDGKIIWKCKKNKKHLNSCPNKLSQVYRTYLYNPFTKKSDIPIKHETRDFYEFKEKHLELMALGDKIKQLYRDGKREQSYKLITQLKPSLKPKGENKQKSDVKSYSATEITLNTSLENAMKIYNEWLKGNYREKWETKKYADKTISNYQRALERFHKCLIENHFEPQLIRISEVNEKHKYSWANEVYSWDISTTAREAYISDIRTFLNWCKDKAEGKVRKRKNQPKKGDKTVTTIKDFEKMTSLITPENGMGIDGYRTLKSGEKVQKKKNYYRSWLKDTFWLSLLLGGRGDEITNFTWNEIKRKEYDGSFVYWIELEDHKVEDADDNIIPIYDKTYEILKGLGLEEKIGSNEYVVAPEIEKRSTMRNFLGKAWKWYWQDVAKLDPNIKWKSLRSTNITLSNILTGDKAKYFKKHTQADTERIHYMNAQVAAASMFREEFKDIEPEKAVSK